ncbi:MAG: ATP-dependent RNA helicase [Verrucomicrobiota bacterium]
MPQVHLPIWQIHADILRELQQGNRLVLVAPTGSGKTTQVPQMLLDAGFAGTKRIVVLQPRRVAARTVAARVSWERQSPLGQEVGYQIRFDDQTSLGTRICYVTEGILLRWLQEDRTLADISFILFDEFHERNLLSDVALALVKDLQQTVRPDLKLAVMSATLEAEPVAAYLGHCPVLISQGQSFPVEVQFLNHRDQRPAPDQAADVVERVVNSGEPGDVLVFMPGMAEINATINALRAARMKEKVAFIPLHGDLPPEEQDLAFAINPLRKIVVATNVAETSVTIDGIRHVVDSGLARIARFDADRGIGTLFVEEISRASADQRTGRAGRTAPGTCYRLWTESGHLNRPAKNTPEIQRADLAEVVLLLHSLGIRQAAEFDWLDKPDPMAVERAEKLLHMLGAIDEISEALTPVGRQMLRLPMHPRYSRMLVEAARHNCIPAAALCAALVSGRDLLMRLRREDAHIAEARELFEASQESDFYTLMLAWQFARKNNFSVETCRRYGIHAQTARQIEQTFEQILYLARALRGSNKKLPLVDSESSEAQTETDSNAPEPVPQVSVRQASEDPLLRCIMAGFIDQLCVRRDRGSLECDLTEGRHGTLMRESVVQNATLFVAALIREVSSRTSENLTLLGLATAVQREWIEEMFPQHLTVRVEHLFDRTHKRVAAVRLVRFRDLIIHHEHQREIEPLGSGRALAEAFVKGWFELPLFSHELKQFRARVNLVAAAMPELDFPALDDTALVERLAHAFSGMTLVKEAQATHLRDELFRHLAREQIAWLDELAPITVPWPDGRKLKLLYVEPPHDEAGQLNPPELQIKLHECFALREHPRICEGKVPVKLWLTGPDGKRIESTCDWLVFKTSQYPRLKSALQKKYPGVAWI